jgi:lipoprotein-releasing system permease protein
VVTVLSVLGVLLGVAVLVIVLSVMSGFDDMWRDKILGFNAHLTVSGWDVLEAPDELMTTIRDVPDVAGVAPFVQGLVFVQHGERVFTPFIRGIRPDLEQDVSRIPDHVVKGQFSVEDDEVVIGRDLAFRLGVTVGDTLLIFSPQNFIAEDELYLPEELTVSGIFEVGMWDFDMGYMLTSLDTARNLFDVDTGVHGLQVMTADPYHAKEVALAVEDALDGPYVVRTWMELNRQLFAALRVEKNMMFFLLIFITVVAAFGITNTLITVTVQKTREIGLLKALGFSSGSIMRVFFWQGWVAGLLGTVFGIGSGLLVLRYRNAIMRLLSYRFNWELFPKELYHLSEIPASTSVTDLVLIGLSVMVICTLAGVVPAYRAARLDPARALHYE